MPTTTATPRPPAEHTQDREAERGTRVDIIGLTAYYGTRAAVADIDLPIEPHHVTALIGPSGCGKSTLLRCINTLHLTVPGARVEGRILLGGADILAHGTDPVQLRRRVGMIFQQPNPFPTMSIYDNVTAGIHLGRRHRHPRGEMDTVVQTALTRANLWQEVRDRLDAPGTSLSGGQQQRLCIARALAVEPEVLLMDEPCSALDPISTLVIEDLIAQLRSRYTIVLVTHDMHQAARVSDTTAFLTITGPNQPGRLVEYAPTSVLFAHPTKQETENYLTGKLG